MSEIESETFRAPAVAQMFVDILRRRHMRPAAHASLIATNEYRVDAVNGKTTVTWRAHGTRTNALKEKAEALRIERPQPSTAAAVVAAQEAAAWEEIDDDPLELERVDRFERRRAELAAEVQRCRDRIAVLEPILAAFDVVAKELQRADTGTKGEDTTT